MSFDEATGGQKDVRPGMHTIGSAAYPTIKAREDVMTILGWHTDVVSIDWEVPTATATTTATTTTTTSSSNRDPNSNKCVDPEQRQPPLPHQHRTQCHVPAHTYIFFIPGNPGLVGWYIQALIDIVQQLGPGFVARGVSYAGHGVTEETVNVESFHEDCHGNYNTATTNTTATTTTTTDAARCTDKGSNLSDNHDGCPRNVHIPWTLKGQIQHKVEWIEKLHHHNHHHHHHYNNPHTEDLKTKRFIFLSHSIGAHMVERILVERPEWRYRTAARIHWMPFIRMDTMTRHYNGNNDDQKLSSSSSSLKQTLQAYKFKFAAHHPRILIAVGRFLLRIPGFMGLKHGQQQVWLDYMLKRTVPDDQGRLLAVRLLQHPTFVRNFLELGIDEIRTVPQSVDYSTLRLLSCIPLFIFHCPNDVWFPQYFAKDIMDAWKTITTTVTSESSSTTENDSKQHQQQEQQHAFLELEYCTICQHDFIVHPKMVPMAVDFVVRAIRRVTSSRL